MRQATRQTTKRTAWLGCTLLAAAMLAGCGTPRYSTLDLTKYPERGQRDNWLTVDTAPDSLALLPAPPQPGSPEFEADMAAHKAALVLRDTPRGQQAIVDASFSPQNLGNKFLDAFGIEISPQLTPITYNLIFRLVSTLGGAASNKAKEHYMRIRPFMYYNEGTCLPEDEHILRGNGSYPSGHTAFGWGAALVLTEISPERQDALLKRGYEYGQSRVICGAHWQSDIHAGRIVAAAAVAKLHTLPEFQRQLKAAKREIAALRKTQQP